MSQHSFHRHPRRGVTLVEMLVAMTLFTLIMVSLGGAVSNMSGASKRTRSIRMALDNVSATLEYMVREVREGGTYHCNINAGNVNQPRDCVGGDDSFSFYDEGGNRTVYRFDAANGRLLRDTPTSTGMPLNDTTEFLVDDFTVRVNGSTYGDTVQSFVTFVIAGHTTNPKEPVSITLQTSVSERSSF